MIKKTTTALTIRAVNPGTKQQLRMRAAARGHSMEEEIRTILDEAASRSDGDKVALRVTGRRDSGEFGGPELRSFRQETESPGPHPSQGVTHEFRDRRVLLIISGGIAAYKSLDVIRRLRERGARVTAVMTRAAQEFVTPLAVGALTGGKVFTELFSRDDEHDVGHIRLAREAALIIVAPATADLIARMAGGHADDLATAILLAADQPILVAPAMNPKMWANPATHRNIAMLSRDGIHFIGPNKGEMAEAHEAGLGRMAEPMEIVAAVRALIRPAAGLLAGRHVIVTSGPTHEPIDPVRYLANRSSGKQGHAIAAAAAAAGARVTLVSGPVAVADPEGATVIRVETARQMLAAVEAALPADVAIMAAAVADWRPAAESRAKLKKDGSGNAAATRAHRESGYPCDGRPGSGAAAGAGDRLRRRNQRPHPQRTRKTRGQGRRLDPRQRRLAGSRRDGRRRQYDPPGQRRWRRRMADAVEGRGRRAADPADRRGTRGKARGRRVNPVRVAIMRLPHADGLALPQAKSALAAGIDLPAAVPADRPLAVPPGGRALIPTGFVIALPSGYEAQVRPRSGLAIDHGVTVLNAPGTIDADYRGEIRVPLINHGAAPFTVTRGMRIAQLVIAPVIAAALDEVAELPVSARGSAGFGSTGLSD